VYVPTQASHQPSNPRSLLRNHQTGDAPRLGHRAIGQQLDHFSRSARGVAGEVPVSGQLLLGLAGRCHGHLHSVPQNQGATQIDSSSLSVSQHSHIRGGWVERLGHDLKRPIVDEGGPLR
jgi:hypothetical protein